ncbi:NAD(P)-dependent oxidoreductase [Streptomyces sp. NPDC102462]|uniref:NAD(P)-dependent oxidoreductase n=1 Tax=Streptomyces sp. NPDC102462 TaxID=3366178 RepID=UPI0037FCF698
MSELRTLGFIGLGKMGIPMASLLHRAGFALVVGDLDEQAVAGFVEDHPGTAAATGPSSYGEVDALVLMVPNSAVVEAVLETDGVAAVLRPGTLVVDMSSSVPTRTRALAARLTGAGLRFVDAPVSGGVRGAVAGKLAVMAGGERSDLDRLVPVFEPLASTVIVVGPVGSGHAAKALNNLVSAATISVTVEALQLGERFGITPETMTEVLNSSSGRSNTSENKVIQFMTSGTFGSGFALHLMAKDVGIAVDLADDLHQEAEVAHEVARQWSRIAAAVSADTDHTRMYELIGAQR